MTKTVRWFALLFLLACSPRTKEPTVPQRQTPTPELSLPLRANGWRAELSKNGNSFTARGHWEDVSGRRLSPRVNAILVECARAERRCDEFETQIPTHGDDLTIGWQGLIIQTHTTYTIATWSATEIIADEPNSKHSIHISLDGPTVRKRVPLPDRELVVELR